MQLKKIIEAPLEHFNRDSDVVLAPFINQLIGAFVSN